MSTFDERGGTKWDRAARYLRIAQVLHAHGESGISAADIAKQIGVSKRTVYRDLDNMDIDGGVPIWNADGRFGLEEGAFLPPLALTLHEAMAFFLAARLLSKATDELDTEIIGAFVKLAQILPPVLAEQLQETADAFSDTPVDETFTRVLRGLTQALADRRIVELEYDAGAYDHTRGMRRVRLHPYAVEPSANTRALYVIGFDEERQARRTYKVERIRSVTLTPSTFPPQAPSVAGEMRSAWDVVGDDTPVEITIRFIRRWPNESPRHAGIPPRSRSERAMGRCCGGPASQVSWRSAPGSWAGVLRQKCWRRMTCERGRPNNIAKPPPGTRDERTGSQRAGGADQPARPRRGHTRGGADGGAAVTQAQAAEPCRVRNVDSGQRYTKLPPAIVEATAGDRIELRGTCRGSATVDRDLVINGRWTKPWVGLGCRAAQMARSCSRSRRT